jgi:hypothetical protein
MATVPGFERSTVDRITKFAWRRRFTRQESGRIEEAAKTDSEVKSMLSDIDSIPNDQGIDPKSPLAIADLQALVEKQILEAHRVDEISLAPIQEWERQE